MLEKDGTGCTKILFAELEIKSVECGKPADKRTQSSALSASTDT